MLRFFVLFAVLVIGPWFVLPPFIALLFGVCVGIPVATWDVIRDTFPKRTDPDVLSSDPAETERLHQDKIGAWKAAMRRYIG